MLPDRVSNPGPRTYESGALPIALRGPATSVWIFFKLASIYHSDKQKNLLDFDDLDLVLKVIALELAYLLNQ